MQINASMQMRMSLWAVCKPLDPCHAGCNLLAEELESSVSKPLQFRTEAAAHEGLGETVPYERHKPPSRWTQNAWVLAACLGSHEGLEERNLSQCRGSPANEGRFCSNTRHRFIYFMMNIAINLLKDSLVLSDMGLKDAA